MSTRIDDIRARLAAATPGPWTYRRDSYAGRVVESEKTAIAEMAGKYLNGREKGHNADLIANAPTDLAYLLELVDQLTEQARR